MKSWQQFLSTCLLAAALLTPSPAPLKAQAGKEDVDVALAIGVDISYSMDEDEQRLQRQGYIEAMTSRLVLEGIRSGPHGRIAVSYYEWAGTSERRTLIPWMVIDGPETAAAFATILQTTPYRRASRTSVSGAIDYGAQLMSDSPYKAIRRVIDISGDGPNNNGRPVEQARDEALAKGIVINGLPIIITRRFNNAFDIENLDDYYEDCVTGGPGSFVISIGTREQFAAATRQKLLKEIAGMDENRGWKSLFQKAGTHAKVDCFVGEKQWQKRFGD